jgi:hypothetical protein
VKTVGAKINMASNTEQAEIPSTSWIFTTSLNTPEKPTSSQEQPSSTEEHWLFQHSGLTPETPVQDQDGSSKIVPDEQIIQSKRGRKSKQSLFPDIIPTANSFIQEHGYEADARRRVDTARSSGVTLQQVRDKLYEKIPGLKEDGLHHTTLHRMMVPPNKKFKAAEKYSSEIMPK